MNILALIFILLIGLLSDWGNAARAFFGYCLAFFIAGLMGRSRL